MSRNKLKQIVPFALKKFERAFGKYRSQYWVSFKTMMIDKS